MCPKYGQSHLQARSRGLLIAGQGFDSIDLGFLDSRTETKKKKNLLHELAGLWPSWGRGSFSKPKSGGPGSRVQQWVPVYWARDSLQLNCNLPPSSPAFCFYNPSPREEGQSS